MPNWGNLVAQGRAKAHGIPWSEAELNALSLLTKTGLPQASAAAYVRDGILTLEDYEEAKASEKKDGVPTSRKSREVLLKEAQDEGIEVTPDATAEALKSVTKKKGGKK